MKDLQDAVSWQELLEQTFADTELSNLKEAIARMFEYLTNRERHLHRPQYDSIFTETAGVLDSPRSRNSSSQVHAREGG